MRICIVIPSFYPAVVYGGWVFSSINTCRELARLGIQSFVSTTNDNGENSLQPNTSAFKKIEDNIYVKYYPQTVKEKFSFSMLFHLWKDIRAADLVHVQAIFSAPTPIGLFFSFLSGKKVLLSPHGCLGKWCLADGSKFKKLYLLFLIRPFANTIWWHATSEQEKTEIKALFPRARVEIIPNGININEFAEINKYSRPEFIEKYLRKKVPAENILISMSRLHKKKGIDILILAFKKSLIKFPHSILLIAGDDFGEKAKLETLLAGLKLEEKIFFIGHLKDQDRIDFFANADAFVLPSHNENFGLVFAEAMAAGTPVIASKGTPWEEVEQLQIGRWVNNDPDTTAEAITDILGRDYQLMGEKSRQFIAANYAWESIGKKFEALFNNMLAHSSQD
jgi:glycosyltransferase involved in cell wall biosynthesis